MRWCWCALAVLSFSARAQEIARVLPEDSLVFLEVREPAQLVDRFREAESLAAVVSQLPTELRAVLASAAKLPVQRAAIGWRPKGFLRSERWTLVLATADPDSVLTTLGAWFPEPLHHRRDAAWLVIGQEANAVAPPKRSLTTRPAFQSYRQRHPNPRVGLHVDLERLVPLRPGLANPDDLGAVFFFGHVLATAAKTSALDGTLELEPDVVLRLRAPFEGLPDSHRFLKSVPAPVPILDVDRTIARLSLTRDPGAFWSAREQLAKADQRESLARFQGQIETILGQLAYDDLLAALGPTADVYFAAPPPDDLTDPRLPSVTLVMPLLDDSLIDDLILTFQSIIGITNIERGGMGQPRFLLESEDHRGVRIHRARHLSQQLPEPKDPRHRLHISLAFAGSRLILGTHGDLVRLVIDAIQDGRSHPRVALDSVAVDVPAAHGMLVDNLNLLAARRALDEGGTVEESRTLLSGLLNVLTPFARATAFLSVESTTTELVLTIERRASSALGGTPR